MATYHDIGVLDAPFIADTDLSGSNQYQFVTAASIPNKVKIATGASNPRPIGVLQNSPCAGMEAKVRLFGPTKVVGAINGTCGMKVGYQITCASTGQAEAVTGAGQVAWGMWISASMSTGSSFGEILLYPASTCAPAQT